MTKPPGLRDSRLIDAVDAKPRESFAGTVWRVAREGRLPTQCGASGGRWDDGTFEVLYTSLEENGALAEMHFHLLRGQPVFPSQVRYALHALNVKLKDVLVLPSIDDLVGFGVDRTRFGQPSYDARTAEYPTTQQIAETAHFLDFKGVIVPNARWDCTNLVMFCDAIAPGDIEVAKDHGVIDWASWRKKYGRT